MSNVTRRDFIKKTSLATAVAPIAFKSYSANTRNPIANIPSKGPTKVYWLEGGHPEIIQGTAFGVPWPNGAHTKKTEFTLQTPSGESVPVQTWVMATWPDGSVKWTGHAIAPGAYTEDYFEVVPGKPAKHRTPVKVESNADHLLVDTGTIQCILPYKGNALIASVARKEKIILKDGVLTGSRQDSPEKGATQETFTSAIQKVTIEQSGRIRAVVKIEGKHQTAEQRDWLPFTVRLYFYAGSDDIRMAHTFVYDGDEHQDFISGLGIRFKVVMHDDLYNRHVRFAGEREGLWAEAVQGLTGLRRDPGQDVREAQIQGIKVSDIKTWNKSVSERIHWVPTWSDYTLTQHNANGFSVKKRTKPGHAWINANQGGRSEGSGYIGGASGGVVFGSCTPHRLTFVMPQVRRPK